MTKCFPLTNLLSPRFQIGDRVQHFIVDEDSEYLLEGTVFGYHYQHQLWADPYDSGSPISCVGWVYCVIQTHEESSVDYQPLMSYFHDNELEPIEGIEAPELRLDQKSIQMLFSGIYPLDQILQNCSISIIGGSEGSQVLIDCANNETIAAEIQRLQSTLRASLRTLGLSDQVSLVLNGQTQGFSQN